METTHRLVTYIALITLTTEIISAGCVRKTIHNFATSGHQTRKLSVFHDVMCKQAAKKAQEIGVPDVKNQSYSAILTTEKEFDATDLISHLAAGLYWQQLLEHRTYRLAALAEQYPTSKIFINPTTTDDTKFNTNNSRTITIVLDSLNRVILQNVATMSTENGKIWIEEKHEETEFKN